MKKALVIGIDDYPTQPLTCCVNDAIEVAELLRRNEDRSLNCDVQLITSRAGSRVTNEVLYDAITGFFTSRTSVETAVLYFAGHGIVSPKTDMGYILGYDARKPSWGFSLFDLLKLANEAHETIHSSVIILDCCHAGFVGEMPGKEDGGASRIGPGVTILTSCNVDENAKESRGHGVFTDLLIDGLKGGCADIRGYITPASLYSHIDQSLGAKEQRPLYKANVQNFVSLRQVKPKIEDTVLLNLPGYFPDPDMVFALDMSYEPDRKSVAEELKNIPVDPDHVRVFEELQMCNRQGLVVPVDAKHMFFAAREGKGCKLTPLGKHYRRLAEQNKI